MDDVNDVVERVFCDSLLSFMKNGKPVFSWQTIDKSVITALELDDVIIDAKQKDLIIIKHKTENWSISRYRKLSAPNVGNNIDIMIRDRKIENIEDVMSYSYTGSIDDITAWCMAIKLKLI